MNFCQMDDTSSCCSEEPCESIFNFPLQLPTRSKPEELSSHRPVSTLPPPPLPSNCSEARDVSLNNLPGMLFLGSIKILKYTHMDLNLTVLSSQLNLFGGSCQLVNQSIVDQTLWSYYISHHHFCITTWEIHIFFNFYFTFPQRNQEINVTSGTETVCHLELVRNKHTHNPLLSHE